MLLQSYTTFNDFLSKTAKKVYAAGTRSKLAAAGTRSKLAAAGTVSTAPGSAAAQSSQTSNQQHTPFLMILGGKSKVKIKDLFETFK